MEKVDIFISHKPPENYPKFPYNGLIEIKERPRYVIGRRYLSFLSPAHSNRNVSMSESTPISPRWVVNCNEKVDEVWVPSQFHVDMFTAAGVLKHKVFKVPGRLLVSMVMLT